MQINAIKVYDIDDFGFISNDFKNNFNADS